MNEKLLFGIAGSFLTLSGAIFIAILNYWFNSRSQARALRREKLELLVSSVQKHYAGHLEHTISRLAEFRDSEPITIRYDMPEYVEHLQKAQLLVRMYFKKLNPLLTRIEILDATLIKLDKLLKDSAFDGTVEDRNSIHFQVEDEIALVRDEHFEIMEKMTGYSKKLM